MITLTAKINLMPENGRLSLNLVNGTNNLTPTHNNISNETLPINTLKTKGLNAFILGASKLGDGSTFSDNVEYFIGNELADEEGNFSQDYRFEIGLESSLAKIKAFNIAFDTANNRHPKTIKVSSIAGVGWTNTISDDDATFTITNDNMQLSHLFRVTINNWNTPKYPIVITGIYANIEINIDNRNLLSVGSSVSERGDEKLPNPGIISNTGDLEFNDLDGEIRDYAEQLLLQGGLKVEIILKDTLTQKEKKITSMQTSLWDYDNNNRIVSVSLKDDLEEWQDIQIKGFDYDPRKPTAVLPNKNFADLYTWLRDRTPSKYNMLSYNSLDGVTRGILANTILPYPLLKDGTLWQQWTKICQVCHCYIYKDISGNTVFAYRSGA